MTGMSDPDLLFANGGLGLSLDGAVARLTIQRPEARNAISLAMWSALPELASTLAANRSVRVLVIAGAGKLAFSAGADISEFAETYADERTTSQYNSAVRTAQASIAALPFPVLAEIRGACFGGGCGLALHCDLRFADSTARFAIPAARLGLGYSFEDTSRLVSIVGPGRAKDLLYSGRTLSADEALAAGMIDFLYPVEELGPAISTYTQKLLEASGTSVRLAKATVDAVVSGADEADRDLRSAFEATFSGADFAEGRAAFLEKRKPDYS